MRLLVQSDPRCDQLRPQRHGAAQQGEHQPPAHVGEEGDEEGQPQPADRPPGQCRQAQVGLRLQRQQRGGRHHPGRGEALD